MAGETAAAVEEIRDLVFGEDLFNEIGVRFEFAREDREVAEAGVADGRQNASANFAEGSRPRLSSITFFRSAGRRS